MTDDATAPSTTTAVDITDLVGVAEIVDRVHLSKQTVSGWYRNGKSGMPKPVLVLKMGALWQWSAVLCWLRETGRGHYVDGPTTNRVVNQWSRAESTTYQPMTGSKANRPTCSQPH